MNNKFSIPTAANSQILNHDESLLLNASGIGISFGGQSVLNNVDITLKSGEVVLLRGDNGSGKTTLLNILTGNLSPSVGQIVFHNGTFFDKFVFPKPWWHSLNPIDHFAPEHIAKRKIGRSWQDVRLFNSQTLQDNIAVATPNQIGENPFWSLFTPRRVIRHETLNRQHADEMLVSLGLGDRALSTADKISFGQSKRVAIAQAVNAGARILFLDEPLAGLDENGRNDIIDLLDHLSIRHNLCIVIVEHFLNIPHILPIIDRVLQLEEGVIVEQSVENVRNETNHQVGNQFIAYCKSKYPEHKEENIFLPGGARLIKLIPCSDEKLQSTAEWPLLLLDKLIVNRGKRNVIGWQMDDVPFVTGVSFTLNKGEVSILMAPNGWGKTTLLNAIAGITPITNGQVFINGADVSHMDAWRRRKLGQVYLQTRNQHFNNLKVSGVLKLSGVSPVPFELKGFANKQVGDLSGGEKQRVALSCILDTQDKAVILLDEPFSALDSEMTKYTWDKISGFIPDHGILLAIPGI